MTLLVLLAAATVVAGSPLGAQAPLGGIAFYQAELTGDQVVPPVTTDGGGTFEAEGEESGTEIRFSLALQVPGVTQVHIHLGSPGENGDVAAFLFGPADPPQDEVNVDGVLTSDDLLGIVAGDWDAFVAALFDGAYVQVHTTANPAGELRGEIFVALTTQPVEPGGGPVDDGSEDDGSGGVQPSSLGDFFDEIVAAGFGPLVLQEIAIIQPWIPVPSAGILVLDGAQAEVYSLSVVEAEQAIGNISGDGAPHQPPANTTVWRGLELIVVLQDAPNHPGVEAALSRILGSPVLATIAGGLPPGIGGDDGAVPEPAADEETVDNPAILPATGSGGLADDGAGSGFERVLLTAGVATALTVAGLLARRRRAA